MSNGRTPLDGGFALEQAKTRDRILAESAMKFRYFFVGLVFAILSFAIQYPIKTSVLGLKFTEATSWGFIAITGLFALIDVGGFSLSAEPSGGLTRLCRGLMWACFLIGIVLLLASKIYGSFQA